MEHLSGKENFVHLLFYEEVRRKNLWLVIPNNSKQFERM